MNMLHDPWFRCAHHEGMHRGGTNHCDREQCIHVESEDSDESFESATSHTRSRDQACPTRWCNCSDPVCCEGSHDQDQFLCPPTRERLDRHGEQHYCYPLERPRQCPITSVRRHMNKHRHKHHHLPCSATHRDCPCNFCFCRGSGLGSHSHSQSHSHSYSHCWSYSREHRHHHQQQQQQHSCSLHTGRSRAACRCACGMDGCAYGPPLPFILNVRSRRC